MTTLWELMLAATGSAVPRKIFELWCDVPFWLITNETHMHGVLPLLVN